MNDYLRESFSYFGLFYRMFRVKKEVKPIYVPYGTNKEQYFLYFEPGKNASDKVIFWVHGGGWDVGNPKAFDFVGQCMAKEGYRVISAGYRLSPKYKYPAQIEDVCNCYKAAMHYLHARGIDTSKVIVAGPSAGAHLTSLLCYSKRVQERYGVNVSNVIGYIGSGGPYSFRQDQSLTMKLLLDQLFKKGYDRRNGEPVSLMSKNHIPMLLIQSMHDGLVEYDCAVDFLRRAKEVGNDCELYTVTDKKNTHSWYTAGMFLETRQKNKGLDKFFSWIEAR